MGTENDVGRIEFANTLRGFSALFVLVCHYFVVFWLARDVVSTDIYAPILSFQTFPTPTYVALLNPTVLFDWGAYGVALFFLISGFVIPFSFKKTDWKGFIANRFFRIFPTYIVGFSITLTAIWLSCLYFNVGFPLHTKEIIFHYIPGLHDIIYSKDIDGVIWTLEIEVKFYLICAIVASFFRAQRRRVFLIPVFLFVSAFFLNSKIGVLAYVGEFAFNISAAYVFTSQYIIFMFIGVTFNYYFRKVIDFKYTMFLIVLLFFFFYLLSKNNFYHPSFHLIWSYVFALVTFIFAYANPKLFKGNIISNFLADISYPLYVTHAIGGYVLLRVFLDLGLKPGLSLLIATSVAIGLSTFIHRYVEVPSHKFGRRVSAKITSKLIVNPFANTARNLKQINRIDIN
ncbi:MAG: acyltransferase [Proteobacteria bacterium]|nr:acyltransferase [Pseudomonadota bacterium]